MFPLYLILIGDLFVGEVGDGHLIVGQLPDFMLGSFAGLSSVEKVSQGLVVNFDKARCEGELIKQTNKNNGYNIPKIMMQHLGLVQAVRYLLCPSIFAALQQSIPMNPPRT